VCSVRTRTPAKFCSVGVLVSWVQRIITACFGGMRLPRRTTSRTGCEATCCSSRTAQVGTTTFTFGGRVVPSWLTTARHAIAPASCGVLANVQAPCDLRVGSVDPPRFLNVPQKHQLSLSTRRSLQSYLKSPEHDARQIAWSIATSSSRQTPRSLIDSP
jgi:hypothetical protein